MRDRGAGPGVFIAPGAPTAGMLEHGNIDLSHRPRVANHGKISTVLSISFNINGQEVLIPRVVGKRILSPQAALRVYEKTGLNLGKFRNAADATAYAQHLHLQQAHEYAH